MTILVIVIILALAFDLINGFHDAANSIATIVSTKVLTPSMAVIWAAFFNFVAYLVFGLHVANTVGTAIAHPGTHVVFYREVLKIIAFIVLAPVIGMVISMIISLIVLSICRRMSYKAVDKSFRRLQLLPAASYSLGHGANDAQKVMGIIFVALIAAGKLNAHDPIPFWIVLSCQCAMAFGTLMGGWRIVRTMGTRITYLRPFEGFSAETAGALTLFGTSLLGIPVSTTHTITGAIIGAGATKRMSAVRWGVTWNIVIAWIITIPITAVLSAIIYYILTLIFQL